MTGAAAYAASKKFTEDTADEMGALKGAPCEIKDVDDSITGQHTVLFGWTSKSGQTQESTMTVYDGEKGDTGATGAQGAQGIQGERGLQGVQGIQGETGAKGDKGDKGDDGYPFLIYKQYDSIEEFDAADFPEVGLMFMVMTAVPEHGYPVYRVTGDLSTPYSFVVYLANEGIKGEKGDKGDKGDTGDKGTDGAAGQDGTTYIPEIGTTTTLPAGSQATASVTVNTETKRAVFSFGIPKGQDGGGSSIKLADVSGAAVAMSFNNATLTWSDPEDIVVSGATLAKWAGTKVLRKAGSAPESITDGVVVVDSKVKNQYSSSGYEDTGLEYGVMYYYRWFPYTDQNIVTDGTAVSVTPARTIITAVPTQDGTLTYDGTEQTASWNDYDSSKMTVTGDTGTNAGTYTAQFTPKAGYCWDDDSITAKDVSWAIDKATGVVTLSDSTISLNADTTYADITVTTNSGGELSVVSSDPTVAAVGPIVSGVFRVTADEAGTATVTVTAAATANYTAGTATATVTVQYVAIYGAEWDGTSDPAWTRTDAAELFTDPSPAVNNGNGSSPFDTIMPWAGMVREERTGGTMVKIPKFWYKWTRDGAKMKLQIADGAVEGFLVSPAHADRGDGVGERDYVYVGAYHCASGTTDKYKSKTGVKPQGSETRAQFRTGIHNLGANIWQYDFAMYWTIMMLYLVEYAHWNTQGKIGYGCGTEYSAVNNGLTDSMTYHTGTNAESRDTYGQIRYRYIEGLWSNVFDWVDGIYFADDNPSVIYCIKNPADFSDNTGGTMTGQRATLTQYIAKWGDPSARSGFEYALYPNGGATGSGDTYVCDECGYLAAGRVLCVGSGSGNYQNRGGFYLVGSFGYTGVSWANGSRIMELP